MGLFGKSKKEETPTLPKLPELPQINSASRISPMTEIPKISEKEDFDIHKLPSFPKSSAGEEFSQNTIKNAIDGDTDLYTEEEEFELPKTPTSPQEPVHKIPEIKPEEVKHELIEPKRATPKEPVFIRIDKFEESLKIFENLKGKVHEIEETLKSTKEIKEKEEQELSIWESEIEKIKLQIEKIDKDIFSKI